MAAQKETRTTEPGAFRKAGGIKPVRTGLWALNGIIITVLAFLVGYAASQKTGIEPGFFEAAEAGGYGAGAESSEAESGDLSEEMQKYYKELSK